MTDFHSAIRDTDGLVDAGFYGFMIFIYLTVIVVVSMILGLGIQAFFDAAHKYDALQLGQAMGLAGAAFSGVATTVGVFRRLDRPAAAVAGTTTRQTLQTTEQTLPLVAAPAAAQAQGPMITTGAVPLSPEIKPSDVGGSVAILPKRRQKPRKAR